MICMLRRRRRNSEPFAVRRSTPLKTMDPEVGLMRRRISRPSVLLPEPDSPTKPSVSPSRTSSDTSSTARTAPERAPPKGDSARAKTFVRLRTSTKGKGHLLHTIRYRRSIIPHSRMWNATRFPHPAIIGTAASAATMPRVRVRLKCSCRKMRASTTVTAG
jgi:hypothetical protein